MAEHNYPLEVRPVIPEALLPLRALADNLLYSWERRVRALFHRIDPVLWQACGHNPKVFLRRVSQRRLEALAEDRAFLHELRELVSLIEGYLDGLPVRSSSALDGMDSGKDLVAYFCMEYGLHESLHLYSGGLGILAGDHCKAASDLGLPFVAVGLTYRQGYFQQIINRDGAQVAAYHPADLDDLPVTLVRDADGAELRIRVALEQREVAIRLWRAQVGRIQLYLLDTEVPENSEADRAITYQLYGGDRATRIAQEMVLGIGGVRALRALGLQPAAWHINEGHAAFMIIERCREAVAAGVDFDAALELVAACTVFTTHTPVAAGHDLFEHGLVARYLSGHVAQLGIEMERLLALGRSPQSNGDFNMTGLALRGSRYQNGVSEIHARVAAEMGSYAWEQISPGENPIDGITNGVHLPTFLAREWVNFFDGRFPDWRSRSCDAEAWTEIVSSIPDHRFWSMRQSLQSEMLERVSEHLQVQYERSNLGRARREGMAETLSPQNTRPLVIGFARRFAIYKRALLIFQDPERLARLLGDRDRPVILLFAGKAHPQDMPGQALIRRISDFASRPPFLNRVFFVEGYDLALARKLVTGVDVWLNTPEYPLEASGTSGQKAAINGVVNLSVLDGWWAEGFNGHNGWGVAPYATDMPREERERLEAEDLLDLLEHEVIPEYFATGRSGFSEAWVRRAKASMYSVLPRFNSERMLSEYATRKYLPAMRLGRELGAGRAAGARELAAWKGRVRARWDGVAIEWHKAPPTHTETGAPVALEVAVHLNGLTAEDLLVECNVEEDHQRTGCHVQRFEPLPGAEGAIKLYRLDLVPPDNGLFQIRVRAFPYHRLLSHPLDMGLMRWL